jgi:hypothetical protein
VAPVGCRCARTPDAAAGLGGLASCRDVPGPGKPGARGAQVVRARTGLARKDREATESEGEGEGESQGGGDQGVGMGEWGGGRGEGVEGLTTAP